MLPRSDSPRKHFSSTTTTTSDHHHLLPRPWLLLTILSLQLLLLFSARFLPISSPSSSLLLPSPPPPTAAATDSTCLLGHIYVYDLPPIFNTDLVAACDDLNPWSSRCAALSNSGFGLPSTDLSPSLIPATLLPTWFSTDQFAAELIYHRRILSHPCRTITPSTASAFYIPFYAGLAIGKYLWNSSTSRDRDFHCDLLLRWVRDQPSWRRSGGWDHFIMLGRITWDFRRSRDGDWGGSFLYMLGMENVTRLLIERNPWDDFDVGVPYPTGFHPRTPSDVQQWQQHVLTRRRPTLFSFAGATRKTIKDDFRGILLSQCREAAGKCRSVDCSGTKCVNRTGATMELFLNSNFCLQPRGDSFTRRSMFDCMVAGSIPVFFWRRSAYVQYGWFLPGEAEEWSVMVDRRGVRNGSVVLTEVLEGIGEEKVRRMRERVVELIPRLVYAQPDKGMAAAAEGEVVVVKDAFEVAVEGVLRRFKEQRGKWRRRRRRAGEGVGRDSSKGEG